MCLGITQFFWERYESGIVRADKVKMNGAVLTFKNFSRVELVLRPSKDLFHIKGFNGKLWFPRSF
jgi:hypothetical protein